MTETEIQCHTPSQNGMWMQLQFYFTLNSDN